MLEQRSLQCIGVMFALFLSLLFVRSTGTVAAVGQVALLLVLHTTTQPETIWTVLLSLQARRGFEQFGISGTL